MGQTGAIPMDGPARGMMILAKEHRHGEIWKKSVEESRARNAQAQARNAQERPVGQEGHEPQAGHRDRPLRSEKSRSEGTAEEIVVQEVLSGHNGANAGDAEAKAAPGG